MKALQRPLALAGLAAVCSLALLLSPAVDRSRASGSHGKAWASSSSDWKNLGYLFAGHKYGGDLQTLRAHVGGGFVKTCWNMGAYYPYKYARVRIRAQLPNGTNSGVVEGPISSAHRTYCVSTAKHYQYDDVIMSVRVLSGIVWISSGSAWQLSPGFI